MTRCSARRLKGGVKQRCTREAVAGGVCEHHGGLAPQTVRAELVQTTSRALDGLVTPIPLDDPEANPAEAIHRDYRRTVARIRFLESRIAEFTEEDLRWGKAKVETTTTGEFPGTTTTWEARVPVFEELLAREREHLLKLTKLMSDTAFKAAELAIQQQSAAYAYGKSVGIVRALGFNPDDPEVRLKVAQVFRPEHSGGT